jgi:hypothetical protein
MFVWLHFGHVWCQLKMWVDFCVLLSIHTYLGLSGHSSLLPGGIIRGSLLCGAMVGYVSLVWLGALNGWPVALGAVWLDIRVGGMGGNV